LKEAFAGFGGIERLLFLRPFLLSSVTSVVNEII